MFAKLFGTDKDQVLLKLDTSESGAPEVRIFHEPEGLGVCSFALHFEDSESGWSAAESAFAKMDEAEARRGITAALREYEALA